MGCVRNCWTDADVDLLRAWYARANAHPGSMHLDDLATMLGRHKSNVARKARALGLTDHRRLWAERDEHGLRACDRTRLPKFTDESARRAHQGTETRERLARDGHPRGALGMKHTDETKAIIAQKSRDYNASLTPEQKREYADKATQTKIERYGTANPSMLAVEQPYSRSKGGVRDDLGFYVRSGWEANYARYLIWLKEQGEIQDWAYEVDVFRFDGVKRGPYTYTPDFKVTERDGSVVYHEVKGWMDGPSKSRLKRMAKHHPSVTIIVIGEDEYKAIAKWREVIPNWEGRKRL
jgi:hypothetical protein